MKTPFVVMGGKIFPGQVIREDDKIIQVVTDAARLVSAKWMSLCFHASGSHQGEALVGVARLTFSVAKAKDLVAATMPEPEGWTETEEEAAFQRLLEAAGSKAESRRKHYRGATE